MVATATQKSPVGLYAESWSSCPGMKNLDGEGVSAAALWAREARVGRGKASRQRSYFRPSEKSKTHHSLEPCLAVSPKKDRVILPGILAETGLRTTRDSCNFGGSGHTRIPGLPALVETYIE